jgi:hypothetical protein
MFVVWDRPVAEQKPKKTNMESPMANLVFVFMAAHIR